MKTNQAASILFVEDDVNLGFLVRENLQAAGYKVTLCKNGEDGYSAFRQQHFHLCLLDVMLPLRDGFSLARDIRAVNSSVPIIFLTSKTMEDDRVEGFLAGADDYIVKPFSVKELLLRISAILRRVQPNATEQEIPDRIRIGQYEFDIHNRLLTLGENTVRLSQKESSLLQVLCENKNNLIQRSKILIKVWGSDDYFHTKSMDVYVTRLRKLLKADPGIEIQNLYSTGFRLIVPIPETEVEA